MKTALILSGGGSRGAIEFGACKVILDKLTPDVIIGTSVGSLNAAAIADGKDIKKNLARLESFWKKVKKDAFFPLNAEFLYKLTKAKSVFSNRGLYKEMKKILRAKRFSDLSIPLYVNCTNLFTGRSHFFSKGKLIDTLVASCSAVPLLPPVIIDGVPYVDGALSSVFGILKAINLKCKKIILVDVEKASLRKEKFESLKEYFDYSWNMMKNQNIKNELELCRSHKVELIEITPPLSSQDILPISFSNVEQMIGIGEKAARKVIRQMKK